MHACVCETETDRQTERDRQRQRQRHRDIERHRQRERGWGSEKKKIKTKLHTDQENERKKKLFIQIIMFSKWPACNTQPEALHEVQKQNFNTPKSATAILLCQQLNAMTMSMYRI